MLSTVIADITIFLVARFCRSHLAVAAFDHISCSLDLLSKLYVGVLTVEVFVKIVGFVFVYGGKGIVNVT